MVKANSPPAITSPLQVSGVVKQLTTVGKMLSHPDYSEAKSGDPAAAARLVFDLMQSPHAIGVISDLAQQLLNIGNLVFLPVSMRESGRINQIPIAMAEYLCAEVGGIFDNRICQVNCTNRTGKDYNYRLQPEHRAVFEGDVVAGGNYIIIDDVMCQGGTLSDLRDYIDGRGGSVLDAVVMGTGRQGAQFLMTPETRKRIESRFTARQLNLVIRQRRLHSGDYTRLTEFEARQIFKGVLRDSVRMPRDAAHYAR